MAFTSAQTDGCDTVFGNKRVVMGTYSQASGDTGGAIVTGLSTVENFHATAATVVVNASGTVTITTADPVATVSGFWMAVGY